ATLFSTIICRPSRPSLFPYTTLFRSIHIPRRVPPSPAPGALRHYEAEAVVLTQGLRMHPRPFGGDRDQKDRGVIGGHTDHACARSEEHTSELQSRFDLVCRLLLEKKK